MKKFRFSLQSVQTVRAIKEMRAREAFSAAVHKAMEAENKLLAVRDRLAALEGLLVSGRSAVMVPSEQVAFLNEYEVQRRVEKEVQTEFEKSRKELDEQRELWIVTRRDLKVIDNLETKARHEYRVEFEREQQALMDDRTNALAGRAPLMSS